MIWKLHYQKTKKYTKCLNIERFFLKIHFEFLDNKHKRMKVIDALGQIYWYTTMCHFLKGFLLKFQNLKIWNLNWNIVAL